MILRGSQINVVPDVISSAEIAIKELIQSEEDIIIAKRLQGVIDHLELSKKNFMDIYTDGTTQHTR